jgi:hypothetical protein
MLKVLAPRKVGAVTHEPEPRLSVDCHIAPAVPCEPFWNLILPLVKPVPVAKMRLPEAPPPLPPPAPVLIFIPPDTPLNPVFEPELMVINPVLLLLTAEPVVRFSAPVPVEALAWAPVLMVVEPEITFVWVPVIMLMLPIAN